MKIEIHKSKLLAMLLAVGLLAMATPASAATIGYWRMETDDDAGGGVNVPNETGDNPLIGTNGSIEVITGATPPPNPLLQTGAANVSALDLNSNVSIAYYSALDVSSITYEAWIRTTEGGATFGQRQIGAVGLRINDPNSIGVQYSTTFGTGTQYTINSGINLDAEWTHIAFTYDQATGVGVLYEDGILDSSFDGPDGEALTWPAGGFLFGGDWGGARPP